jgi:tetratricopeptide (TPR) repeat protein
MEYAKQGYQYVKGQMSTAVQELVANGTAQSVTTGQSKELNKCGQLAYLSGNYEEAYTYYSVLYSAGEDGAALYMGHCLAESGQYEQALELFDNYESKHGEQPLSVAKKAYCKMQLEQYAEALELIDKALAMDGQQLGKELLYEKGVALERTGDFDSAFDCFAEYVEQYPEDTQAQREYDFLVTRLSDEKAEAVGVDNGD